MDSLAVVLGKTISFSVLLTRSTHCGDLWTRDSFKGASRAVVVQAVFLCHDDDVQKHDASAGAV